MKKPLNTETPLTKAEMNSRAYQRKLLRERNKAAGVTTAENTHREKVKTPGSIHGQHLARRGTLRSVDQLVPTTTRMEVTREWIDTREDRAAVAAILNKPKS